jgi:two-component system, LytTR family, sensor kinase
MIHRRPSSLFWPLQVGGWAAFGTAMALSRVGIYPLDYMVVSKGMLAGLGFAATLGLRSLYRWLLRRRQPAPVALLGACVVVSCAASLLMTGLYNVASAEYASSYFGRPVEVGTLGQLFSGAVYHAFALLAWSVLYFGIKYHLAYEAEHERSLRAEAHAHQAQLRALRYQINPHFLFNTLNAISAQVVMERNQEATKMIARLSDLLRLTLGTEGRHEVPLGDEVDFLRRYLEIEQLRFGDRLRVEYDVPVENLAACVPAMMLQPLVENAIKHAIAPREAGGSIAIRAWRDGDTLALQVLDDGPGFDAGAAATHDGVGLANVRERLLQLYDDRGTLDVGRSSAGGAYVTLRLPFREAETEPLLAIAQ